MRCVELTKDLSGDLSKRAKHFGKLCGVYCNVFDVDGKEIQGVSFCGECDSCDYVTTHKYGCFEAQRWGGKYIYYCPAGFIFIAVVLCGDVGGIEAGILTGPILMGNPEDFPREHRFDGYDLPNVETPRVNDMSEVLAAMFCGLASGRQEYDNLLNDIYKARDRFDEDARYPLDLEKQLQNAIKDGDARLAKALLNRLLGLMFFSSNGDFKTIKARALELIVLLSRSAIDGGADLD
ncbi:MAG: PocR ligand-binding domain-containing protein, partial [Clostridiales bacterium]|nr:PocR ligand-binding domain-containing protein [Clostridiales bacterium]